MDINYLKHLKGIYAKFINIVGKESDITWKVLGQYAYQKEQYEFDYESFGRYVAKQIEDNMK